MSILKNLICQTDTWNVVSYIIDVILIIIAIVWLVSYFVKMSKHKKETADELSEDEKNILQNNVEKIDADTYVIESEPKTAYENPLDEKQKDSSPVIKDNVVEHFSNQLNDINNDITDNNLSKTAPEMFEKKSNKEEIYGNFVEVDGVRTSTKKANSGIKRGTNAYVDTENLINTIKEETAVNEKKKSKPRKTKKS